MDSLTDDTRGELLDSALDILECRGGEKRKIARGALEQIVEAVGTDFNRTNVLSRADAKDRLAELARALETASEFLDENDLRRVLELQIPATRLSRLLPDSLPIHLRKLAEAASNAAADPDLHGGGNAALEDVFDLPAKTKLAALVDPVFEHFRGKRGATSANSDLDVLLCRLWEVISGKEEDESFERQIQQARAKKGRRTARRYAALTTARLEAGDILDEIRRKSDR